MAGYDVVIAGFRLNAKEQPAKVLERLLAMSAEQARVCSKNFPHVALSNASREAAEALQKRLDEAGARASVTPHQPGAVIANDTARPAPTAEKAAARSVSLAAIEPLEVQERVRPPQVAKPRPSAAAVSRPTAPAAVPDLSDALGGYALGDLALDNSVPVALSQAAPAPVAKPVPAAKSVGTTVKNDFDLEEDFAAGSGLDLDMASAPEPSLPPGRSVAPAKLRGGSPAPKMGTAKAAAKPDALSIGGGGRDLDDTFSPEGEGAAVSLEVEMPRVRAAAGAGLKGGGMVTRHRHHQHREPQPAPAPRRSFRGLYVTIALVLSGAFAAAWFLTPWFQPPPAEVKYGVIKAPPYGLLTLSGEEPIAASFSMRRGAKEGVIVPAHEMLVEVHDLDGPVVMELEARFADRTGRWVALDGDPQALRGQEIELSVLDGRDDSASDTEGAAFVAWPGKGKRLLIERAWMVIEDVGAREVEYASPVYPVKARFGFELDQGGRREAHFTGHLHLRRSK